MRVDPQGAVAGEVSNIGCNIEESKTSQLLLVTEEVTITLKQDSRCHDPESFVEYGFASEQERDRDLASEPEPFLSISMTKDLAKSESGLWPYILHDAKSNFRWEAH
jgi:hypothetical protein